MSLDSVLLILLIVFTMLVGVEIVAVIGLAAIGLTLLSGTLPLANFGITAFESLNSTPFIALPLFVLTGTLILKSGIADQLVRFAKSLVGTLPGGLAVTSLVACGFFAAISGSNSATVATIGQIMLPRMDNDNYPRSFTLATVAAGGTVGVIIPPSIVFILYGVATGVSVSALFLAGIIPGILMIVAMSVVAVWAGARNGWGTRIPFSFSEVGRAAWETKWAGIAVFIILGGIYGGVFTPTEAAAVSAIYCLAVGLFVTRQIGWRDLPSMLASSAHVTGIIAPIIAVSLILSQAFAILGFADVFVSGLTGVSTDPTILLLLIMAVILITGCFIEATPALLILSPLFSPLVSRMEMSPVHFGVVMVVGLTIGFITPPMGLNLFVASSIGQTPIHNIATHTFAYLLVLLLVWLAIAFWPALSLALL
jgi:C4-dicarboxylate transporter DctM subunit